MKKTAYYIFYTLLAVFLLWITIAGVCYVNGNVFGQLLVAAVMAGGMVVVGVAAYRCAPVTERAYRIAVPVLLGCTYVMLTAFGIRTMTVPISDLEVLVNAADHLLNNGDLFPYSGYFTICRNTLGNALFLALSFWPLQAAGISIYSDLAEAWGIAVNCAMLICTVFLLWLLVKRVVHSKNLQLLFLLLALCYVPFYLWAHRYYSDTLSLPFLPLAVLLYDNARRAKGKNSIWWSCGCGVCVWLGYFIRGSLAIVLAAIVIYALFCDGRRLIKTVLPALLTFALISALWNIYLHNNSWIDFSDEEALQYPTEMWLMYGAHGEGNYCDEDVQMLQALPDYTARKEKAVQMLKEYYGQYTPAEYVKFLTLKYGKTWGNGLFDSEKYLNNQRTSNFTHMFLLDGMPYTAPFRYLANGLHFAILALNVAGAFLSLRKKEWTVTLLLQIVFFGNILFLSFWETKARYAFGVTPIMLLVTVVTMEQLAEVLSAYISKKKAAGSRKK